MAELKLGQATPFKIAELKEIKQEIPKSSEPKNLRSRVSNVAQTAFNKAKKAHTWGGKLKSIAVKTLLIGKNLASPASKTAKKVGKVVQNLRIFAVLDIPFNIYDAGMEAWKIPKYISIKDWEGVSLSLSSIMLLAGDTFDALATVGDLIVSADSNPAIAMIGQVLIPLGIALVTTSTVIKGYRLATTAVELHKANKKLKNGTEEDIKNYVTKLAGITEGDLKKIRTRVKDLNEGTEEYNEKFEKEKNKLLKLKTNRLQRRANKKAADALKKLSELMQDGKKVDNEEIQKAMKQLKTSLIQTTCVHSANILANMVMLTGLGLTFAPIPPVAPLVILLAGSVAKLGIMISDEFVLDHLIRRMV